MQNQKLMVAGAKKPGTFVRLAVLSMALIAPLARADAVDYSSLTSAVDWSAVITAIITVLAAGAAVLVAFVGGKFIVKAIRGS